MKNLKTFDEFVNEKKKDTYAEELTKLEGRLFDLGSNKLHNPTTEAGKRKLKAQLEKRIKKVKEKLSEGIINEGSYEDFISTYGKEVKSLIKTIEKIGKQWEKGEILDDSVQAAFVKIDKIYDPEVGRLIDSILGGRSIVQDVGQTAIDILNKYGTEPMQVVNAMSEFTYNKFK